MNCDLNIDAGGFLSFADYFFDGFFVDWMVQDKINRAKEQVSEAIRQVERVMDHKWEKHINENPWLVRKV